MAAKTLITGGAGFIGSHLVEHIKAQGRDLVVVDNLSSGLESNIQPLLDVHCQLIASSVRDAVDEYPKLFADIDEVYHLAASVGVRTAVATPIGTIANNIEETRLVLEQAKQQNARVLICSSSEVYGKPMRQPMSEDDDLVIGPPRCSRWSFALSKAVAEQLSLAFAHQHGLAVTVVRLFNTIGPRQVGDYGMVVPRFVQRAVRGDDLEIHGDGSQRRSFCDVQDVVSVMPRLLACEESHGQVFNIGGDTEISIDQLADLVIELSGGDIRKRYVPYDQAFGPGFEDPARRIPDLSKLREIIDYTPRNDLRQTLSKLIRLAKQEHRTAVSSTSPTR